MTLTKWKPGDTAWVAEIIFGELKLQEAIIARVGRKYLVIDTAAPSMFKGRTFPPGHIGATRTEALMILRAKLEEDRKDLTSAIIRIDIHCSTISRAIGNAVRGEPVFGGAEEGRVT